MNKNLIRWMFLLEFFVMISFHLSCGKLSNDSKLDGTAIHSSDGQLQITSEKPWQLKSYREYFEGKGKLDLIIDAKAGTFDDYNPSVFRPYLIYYVVDSLLEEPFFKASVEYEIDMLKKICVEGANHVNWLIIRNTDVVLTKTYEICQGGRYKKKDLSFFIEKIQQNYLTNGKEEHCFQRSSVDDLFSRDHNSLFYCGGKEFDWPHGKYDIEYKIQKSLDIVFDDFELEISNNHTKNNLVEKYIEEYPLADINVFNKIVSSENRLLHPFHRRLYAPFFHIKSHGHHDYVLTGLSKEQLFEKIKRQKSILNQSLQSGNQSEELILKKLGLSTNVKNFTKHLMKEFNNLKERQQDPQYFSEVSIRKPKFIGVEYSSDSALTPDNLSEDCGLGGEMEETLGHDNILDQINISDEEKKLLKNGLGSPDSMIKEALSIDKDIGLGSKGVYLGNQIGVTPNLLFNVIEKFDRSLSVIHSIQFMMLEACDTNLGKTRWKEWHNLDSERGFNEHIDSFYSAGGSLWYRNMDWHNLFQILDVIDDPNKHTRTLKYLLNKLSEKIPNVNHSHFDEQKERYIKTINELKKLGVHQ